MIKEVTAKLMDRQNLSYEEAMTVMNEMMSGSTTPVQTAAFLAALRTKGETIEEITACAAGMRAHATPVAGPADLFEIVGTGGDGSNSFNISTTASLVIAAGGVKVAKHGNRAASSKSGAADCLEALGVQINQNPEQCRRLLDRVGICFLFAPCYHASMKHVGPVRKEMGTRTVFNILGPLTNPASATQQVMGVYAKELVEPLARVLANLGVRRGMVVYGTDGMDEISLSAPTVICEFEGEQFKTTEIRPEDFGFESCPKGALAGGSPAENAAITRAVLEGKRGPQRDAVLLNAGAGLYVSGRAPSFEEGVRLAGALIDAKRAKEKLEAFILESNREERP